MFTHPQVWDGIDKLAKEKGWSPSRLAREAGLDPTTFNKSKRHTNQAKPRWPSTESLAKILDATSTSLESFVALMSDRPTQGQSLPSERLRCASFSEACQHELFDESGFPVGQQWDEIDFPSLTDQHGFALEIQGDSMVPFFRDGDILIVSPNASVRRNDRVVLRTGRQALELGILTRRTAQRIELHRFDEAKTKLTFSLKEILWLSRVVWASQ